MRMQPAQAHSDTIRQQVLALIQNGDLGADGRLPTERELSERFAVGRRLIRQALDALQADGLVWRRQGKGTFAGQPSDPTGALAAEIAGETNVLQVMEARLCIEPELAGLSALRATPDDIARIRTLAKRQFEAADHSATELWDGALHRLIATSAGNRPLLTAFAMLDEIRSTGDWVSMRAKARSRASLDITMQEHQLIIDAIGQRDAVAARAAMRAHLETRFNALRDQSADFA